MKLVYKKLKILFVAFLIMSTNFQPLSLKFANYKKTHNSFAEMYKSNVIIANILIKLYHTQLWLVACIVFPNRVATTKLSTNAASYTYRECAKEVQNIQKQNIYIRAQASKFNAGSSKKKDRSFSDSSNALHAVFQVVCCKTNCECVLFVNCVVVYTLDLRTNMIKTSNWMVISMSHWWSSLSSQCAYTVAHCRIKFKNCYLLFLVFQTKLKQSKGTCWPISFNKTATVFFKSFF